MPSGAKKRKAAKKKKENQTSNESTESTASTYSHGEEGMKHQEDDIGDVTSPKSEDILGKEEELIEKERGSSNSSSTQGSRIGNGEKRTVPEEGIVPVERNFKIEDGLDGKDGGIEGKSYIRGSFGSSSSRSSSSDYEIKASVKNCEPAGNMDISLFAHSSSTSNEWVVVNLPAADSEKISALMKQAQEGTDFPHDISRAPYVVESMMKDSEDKRLILVDERGGNSSSSTKTSSEREDGEFTDSFESTGATHDQKECVAHENDHRLVVPQDISSSTAESQKENVGDFGITEPLLVPSPRLVQKTSWKGCCGLFDLFSGSGA